MGLNHVGEGGNGKNYGDDSGARLQAEIPLLASVATHGICTKTEIFFG